MEAVLVLVGLVLLAVLGPYLGVDSRDGQDWQPIDGVWRQPPRLEPHSHPVSPLGFAGWGRERASGHGRDAGVVALAVRATSSLGRESYARSDDVVTIGPRDAWRRDEAGAPVAVPSKVQKVRSLVALLDGAVDLLLRTAEIVTPLRDGIPLAAESVRVGAQLDAASRRLRVELEALDVDDEMRDARAWACSLLRHHEGMLRECLTRGVDPHPGGYARLRQRIDDLEAARDRLRDLRNQLRAGINVRRWNGLG